ncbi:MAG: hypothetical protein JRI51_12560, partial [Deltaproteobacteria bacterium]|nr:hypothetical protein [Deltaproteobacteria bacterium]
LVLTLRHGERVWPEPRSIIYVLGFSMVLAAVFTPGLNAEASGVHVRGPWYFVGLQEILHWTSRPIWVVVLGMAGFVFLFVLPFVPKGCSRKIKCTILACLIVYLSLIVIGIFFRGTNWELIWPLANS